MSVHRSIRPPISPLRLLKNGSFHPRKCHVSKQPFFDTLPFNLSICPSVPSCISQFKRQSHYTQRYIQGASLLVQIPKPLTHSFVFNILKTLLLVVTTTHLRATRPDTPLFKTGYYAVTACLTPKNQRVMGLMDGPKDQLTDIAGFSMAST